MPIFKKTKCKMKWCYSPLRHEDGTCDKFCTYNTIRVQTNADCIRQMTDEELAIWINDVTTNALSVLALRSNKQTKTVFYWLEWLKKEASE